MTITKRLGWTTWALAPIVLLSYHFGAGQRLAAEQRAERLLEAAALLEAHADEAQGLAHNCQLGSIEARRALRAEETPTTIDLAKAAREEEVRAYRVAAAAWQTVADKLGEAEDLLTSRGSDKAEAVRLARGSATIRAGRISEGVANLESMLGALDEQSGADAALARRLREEIATGYYYGARLMRISGSPDAEWRAVSGVARQNFRYLAEHARATGTTEADDLQKNLELILDLEQAPPEELLAKPLPRNSPGGNCDCSGLAQKAGKGKRPSGTKQDARGAGGVGDIPPGW